NRSIRRNQRSIRPLGTSWVDFGVINNWMTVWSGGLRDQFQILLRHLTAIPLRSRRLNVDRSKEPLCQLVGNGGGITHRVEQEGALFPGKQCVRLAIRRTRSSNCQAGIILTNKRPVVLATLNPLQTLNVDRNFRRR